MLFIGSSIFGNDIKIMTIITLTVTATIIILIITMLKIIVMIKSKNDNNSNNNDALLCYFSRGHICFSLKKHS